MYYMIVVDDRVVVVDIYRMPIYFESEEEALEYAKLSIELDKHDIRIFQAEED